MATVTRQQKVEKGAEALVASIFGTALNLRLVEAKAVVEIVLDAVEGED